MADPQSRSEEILQDGIDRLYYDREPQSRIESKLIELIENGGGGGGGGTTVAGVTSFNGRRNRVMPQSGDYSANMISTGTSGMTVQSYINDYILNKDLDTALNPSSERAVQNKVITNEITKLEGKVLPAGGAADAILTKNTSADYDVKWNSTSAFMLKSTYDRNNNGKVDSSEKADAVQGPIYKATLKGTHADATLLTNEDKGVPNGVVPLDSTRKILPEYLPDSIMNGLTHGGIFDASTLVVTLSDAAKSILHVTSSTMTLEDSPTVPQGYPANAELYYICTEPGTFANMTFVSGDWLISLGNQWNQLKNGNQVSSVNGLTGAVQINSDQIPQGVTNLYFTNEEKAKLRGIEDEATKDVDVVQSATIRTTQDGTKILRLANKNGTVVEFEGNDADMTDYLKVNGNGSNVTTTFTPAISRTYLNGNETIAQAFSKIARIALDLQTVAYSANYEDLVNTPKYTGDFQNNGSGNANYPYIDKRVNDLQNYWNKTNSYSKTQIDNLLSGLESIDILIVSALPTRDIRADVEYWIPKDPESGYSRYRYVQGDWADLGDTNIDLSEYLKVDGDGSNVTSSLTIPAARGDISDGDSLSVALGKIQKMYSDLKEVAFGGSYEDLEDGNLLALKEELDDYLLKQFNVTDAGKVLVVGSDGKVTVVEGVEGVIRKGTGSNAIIANDTEEDPVNIASGERSSAFGDHTVAAGKNGFAIGRYNVRDNNSQFVFQVGNGEDNANRADIFNVQWDGRVNVTNQIGMGTNTNPIVPRDARDVTNKFYVDNKIVEEIANAGLLKAMIVNTVPLVDDADINVLYLVPDPTSEGHYNQYKKVLQSTNPDVYIMANLGGTQLSMEGSQVKNLPTASAAYANMVYQYVGDNSALKFGANYACLPMTFYAWYDSNFSKNYYTDTLNLSPGDPIYATQVAGVYHVASKIGANESYLDLPNRIRDQFNIYGEPAWYTRNSSADTIGNYRWVPLFTKLSDFDNDLALSSFINDMALSEFTNDGTGSGEEGDYYVTKNETDDAYKLKLGTERTALSDNTTFSDVSTLSNTVFPVQWSIIKSEMFKYMWNKIYPVGSIYTTTDKSFNPSTSFGGTWVHVGTDRVLWGVETNVDGGSNLDEQLPDIRGHIDWKDGGQAKTEISNGSGAFNLTNKNLGAAYPTGTGASSSARGFDFRASYYNSVYKLGAVVRPNAYTVHFWRRTA